MSRFADKRSSLTKLDNPRFRWVQCQLDQIRTMRTNKKIIEAMKNLPIGLFATYDRILKNILHDDVDFAQKTLSWLLVSNRPLRLTEIVDALAVDVQLRCLDRDATLNDEQDLLEICSSLVAYNEDTGVLSFSHFSVQVCLSLLCVCCDSPDIEGSYLGVSSVLAPGFWLAC
jgi:hypothetical protein